MSEKNDYKWMVRVGCMTFNHASYIEDAMNGFTMQQTSFPFVCTIIDDASTDGEQEVIKNYLNEHFDLNDKNIVRQEETDDYLLTFARHKINLNCYFAVLFLKYNHYSIKKPKLPYIAEWNDNAKYIASCEGDDYWIDSEKLQRQVDALDNNPECLIAYCRVQRINKDGSYIKGETIPVLNQFEEGEVTLDDFCKEEFYNGRWCFNTVSFMMRKESVESTPARTDFYNHFPWGDMAIELWCLVNGKGYFVNRIGCCYRVLSGGYNSYAKSHPDYFIKQESKLIDALEYLNDYTKRVYEKAIQMRILWAHYKIEKRQRKKFLMLRKKYRPLLHLQNKKATILGILQDISPSLHSFVLKIHNII